MESLQSFASTLFLSNLIEKLKDDGEWWMNGMCPILQPNQKLSLTDEKVKMAKIA